MKLQTLLATVALAMASTVDGMRYSADMVQDAKHVAAQAESLAKAAANRASLHANVANAAEKTAHASVVASLEEKHAHDPIFGTIEPIAAEYPRPESAVPLYRYWNKEKRDHLYVASYDTLKNGRDGYALQSVEGYVFADAGAADGLKPVYRLFDRRTDDHALSLREAPPAGTPETIEEFLNGL